MPQTNTRSCCKGSTVVLLAAAQAKIAETNALLATSIDVLSDTDKAIIKPLIEEIKTLLKESRSALIDSLKALKESIVEARQAQTADDDTEDTEEDN